MRTKTLLVAAALLAGVSSSMAQVYSVNAVGFVNVPLEAGKFKMVANPLNTSNNTLAGLFPTVPEGTVFYKYTATGYQIASFEFDEWSPNFNLNPGEGGFMKSPSNVTLTFVGEVPQSTGGASLDLPLKKGFQIVGSVVPQSLVLSDSNPPAGVPNLNFPVEEGDIIYLYRNNAYETHFFEFGAWDKTPGPTPNVAEAFWVRKISDKTWTRTFTVN